MQVSPKSALSFLLFLFFITNCSGPEKKDSGEPVSADGNSKEERDETPIVSANRITLTNSWSNNPLTSQTINRGKAESLAESLNGKDKKTLEGKASAMRLSGKSGSALLSIAKKIAELEMAKAPNKEIDSALKLEIALAAMSSKEFTLAYYLLEDIIADTKAPKNVRAGAHNAMGVIALRDDRIPEAVLEFRQALKDEPNYKPAKLNLAFTALKGGGLGMAKQIVSDYQNDWFAQYGLISVERMEGDTGRAADLCDKVLGKESAHKAALFNCAMVEAQNKKNFKKAIELLERAAKAKGGEAGWDERIQAAVKTVENDLAEEKAKSAQGNPPKPQNAEKPNPQ